MPIHQPETRHEKIPPETDASPKASRELLDWMGTQFERLGDIFKSSVDGVSTYFVREPRYAEHVLRTNWQNYVKGRTVKRIGLLLGNGLMVSEGQFWKKQRRMIQPAFHRAVISGLTDVIAKANAELVENWERAARRNESVNVTDDVSRMVLKITLTSIFGEDYERVRRHFDVLANEAARDVQFAEDFRASGLVISEIAARRRQNRAQSPDILGLLVNARDAETGDAMTERQLVSEIKTLIVASHETTASTLNWMWYLLSQHREVEQRLSRELANQPDEPWKCAYVSHVIDEAMRLYPAGWLITRQALEDDWLGDYFLPAKTEIYVPIYFIQRHPNLWERADMFDPGRFDGSPERHRLAMLPFSAGPRNCIGEMFARAEMQIHLAMVASRLRLQYAGTVPPEVDAAINLRTKTSLRMVPQLARPD